MTAITINIVDKAGEVYNYMSKVREESIADGEYFQKEVRARIQREFDDKYNEVVNYPCHRYPEINDNTPYTLAQRIAHYGFINPICHRKK